MRGLKSSTAIVALLAVPVPGWAQDSGDNPPPIPVEEPATQDPIVDAEVPAEEAARAQVFQAADFARFAPRSALDMLNQVPGFVIVSEQQGRGLGQTRDNVLVNGERLASKSESLFDQLQRIPANRVQRIEIVDGATLGIPGLSGQVANIFTQGGGLTGRFEYRATARPKYAEPGFVAGEVSLSGSTPRLEWNVAATHNIGRGAAVGPGYITDGEMNVIENRDIRIKFIGEYPKLSGSVKWDGPGSMVANLNANYNRTYTDFSNDEQRHPVVGIDSFRDFDNSNRGWGYEFGGDVDFALGPGRLKLIGIDRYSENKLEQDSILTLEDDSPPAGNRFALQSETGEIIGRAEYRWDMIGGSWQLDGEAAFNRLDQTAQLYELNTAGDFVELPFPAGSGGVTEDRYESILTHNRTLARGLTLQIGAGGEYSKLAQTGPGGLVRTFWRPKGSATLAWTPETGLDLSLKLARVVGQLSFSDFLARVFLDQANANAGNAELVPPQSWELDLEVKKNLKAWGSANIRFYGRWYEDLIEIIPVGNGLESSGNIDKASLYGIAATATINLDPIGWKGAKIDFNTTYETSQLEDPLTLEKRPFSGNNDFYGEISLRYDLPASDWAFGGGFNWTHVQPYIRLFEIGKDYEGPIYTFAFVENKDVFGMTVNLQVFNVTDGRGLFHRTVWAGYRDRSPILFTEHRDLSVQPIFRLQVKGNF